MAVHARNVPRLKPWSADMQRIGGFIMVALMVLGTVWLYNRFSGKTIDTLGVKAA